jgi:hypothetical protein
MRPSGGPAVTIFQQHKAAVLPWRLLAGPYGLRTWRRIAVVALLTGRTASAGVGVGLMGPHAAPALASQRPPPEEPGPHPAD